MFSRNQLIFTIISLILAVPPFFFGGRSATAAVIAFVLAFPLVYFVFSTQPDFKKIPFLRNPFVPLGGFVVLAAVSYFYSSAPAQILNLLFYWIFYGLMFFSIFYFLGNCSFSDDDVKGSGEGDTGGGIKGVSREIFKFGKLSIWLGAVLSIIGIYFFWVTELYSYLRLGSTFYRHNSFAAFLLVPFFVLLSLFFTENDAKKLRLFFILAVLFSVTLFFTYSRGGWISFIVGFALLVWFLRKKIGKAEVSRFAAILAVSIFLIFGLRAIKEKQAVLAEPAIKPTLSRSVESGSLEEPKKTENKTRYSVETKEENALLARLAYWRGALRIFKDNPIFGSGFGSYRIVYQKYLKDVRYYSVAPHNFYLKVLAELGIVGFSLWMWFIGMLVYFIWKIVPFASAKGDFAVVGFGLGLFAFLVNIGGELSLYFPANAIMFFFAAAIVSNYYVTQK